MISKFDHINSELSRKLTATTTTATIAGNVPVNLTNIDYEKEAKDLKAELNRLKSEIHKPFDETAEFREFVVWLCGYTARHTPPDKAEWEELRDQAKAVAAKFALATRARRQQTSAYSVHKLSGTGITGDTTLIGNEELFTTTRSY